MGHSNSVYSLAILENNLIVSGSLDRTIKIWHADTAANVDTFNENSRTIFALAVLSNGLIVSGQHNSVKIWNVKTGRLERTMLNHS